MATDYKGLMNKYTKRIEELSGVQLRFYGCNGEWAASNITPWTYLHGYHSRRDICLYLEGIIAGLEHMQHSMHRKYGMNIKELRDKIADFTGDKKGEALRKARIFASHISLRHVSEIVSMKYGHRTDEHGNRTEDPKWIEIRWRDLDGDCDWFSIIE